MDNMKENIVFIVLLFIGIGAGYAVGLYVGKDRTEDTYRDAPRRRDTTTTVKERPLPEQKKQVKQPVRPVPQESRLSADSVFNAGLAKGMDSLRSLFAWKVAPRETTVTFDTVGTLIHQSDRLRDMEIYTFQPFPRKEIERIITDSIYVPMVNPAPWYDHWYWGAIGAGAIALTAKILAK